MSVKDAEWWTGPIAEEYVDFHGLYSTEWDEWAYSGRLDAKGLRKALPQVAKALEEGKIDPEAMAKVVTFHERAFARRDIPNDLKINGKTMLLSPFSLLGTEICGLHTGQPENLENEDLQIIYFNFVTGLKDEFDRLHNNEVPPDDKYRVGAGCSPEGMTIGNYRVAIWYSHMHQAFDKLCMRYEDRVKKATKKTIAENSQLHQAKPYDFDHFLDWLVEAFADKASSKYKAYFERIRKVNLKHDLVITAAECITEGSDSLMQHVCWECNTSKGEGLQKCSGCGVAKYCCRKHQSKAWKEGHRHSCLRLKTMHDTLKANLKSMDTRIKANDIFLGQRDVPLPLCPNVDSKILLSLSLHNIAMLRRMKAEENELLSMEHYYSNLGDIWDGQCHFAFEDTPVLDLSLTNGNLPKTMLQADESVKLQSFAYLAALLGHSVTRLLTTSLEADLAEMANATKIKFLGESTLNVFARAEDFFSYYKYVGPDENHRKEYRRMMLDDIMFEVRRDLHKLPTRPECEEGLY